MSWTRWIRWLLVVTLVAIGFAGFSCKPTMPGAYAPPTPPLAPALAGPFLVGAARVDITPPPGVSTFGHGPDALVTNGLWTRLYCRVFVLIGKAGPVAIVPCDLPATSTILQRSVAERVMAWIPDLPTSRIFISATHTHAGPAHFFDGDSFDGTLSSHMPGFDRNMVDFLAQRIAVAVRDAFVGARPATITAWHYDTNEACTSPDGGSPDDCGTWGIAWNRSEAAHESGLLTYPVHTLNPQPPKGLCKAKQAVDPALHILRFDDEALAKPIGELVYFAMHPTVLPSSNRLLGADVDGALSRLLERDMQRTWNDVDLCAGAGCIPHDPLAGIVNTNEGDMSPDWRSGTKEEVLEVANKLKAHVDALAVSPAPKDTAIIDARYVEVDLPNADSGDRKNPVCATAEIGESVPYGACDHPTTEADPAPGSGASEDEFCQAPKVTPGGLLENIFGGGQYFFPTRIPLAVIQIGDTLISTVPAEMTISAGAAVNAEVLQRFRADPGTPMHAVVSGLSNGYILYVTTPGEYRFAGYGGGCAVSSRSKDHCRQSYEGSATVYGPGTLLVFKNTLGMLARDLSVGGVEEAPIDQASEFLYDTAGPSRGRFPMPTGAKTKRARLTTCQTTEGDLCLGWLDGSPGDVAVTNAPWVYLADVSGGPPDSEVRACGDANCDRFDFIDDRGTSFVTRAGKHVSDGLQWATIWHATPGERVAVANVARMTIRVRDRYAGWVESAPFRLSGGPYGSFQILDPQGQPGAVPSCDEPWSTVCGKYEDASLDAGGKPPVVPLPEDCIDGGAPLPQPDCGATTKP